MWGVLADTLCRTASAAATLSRSTACTSASREVPRLCPCHSDRTHTLAMPHGLALK